MLAASGQIPTERMADYALFGELSLDGEVRPCNGSLAIAQATQEAGMSALVLAPERAREAMHGRGPARGGGAELCAARCGC